MRKTVISVQILKDATPRRCLSIKADPKITISALQILRLKRVIRFWQGTRSKTSQLGMKSHTAQKCQFWVEPTLTLHPSRLKSRFPPQGSSGSLNTKTHELKDMLRSLSATLATARCFSGNGTTFSTTCEYTLVRGPFCAPNLCAINLLHRRLI